MRRKMRIRYARLAANSWETCIAILCVVSALAYLYEPGYVDRSAVGQLSTTIAYAWVIGLLASASAILAGLWFGKAHWEVAGLILIAAVIGMQAIAIVDQFGARSVSSVAIFVAVAWASLARARMLTHASAELENDDA